MGPELVRVEPPIITPLDAPQEPTLGEIGDTKVVTNKPRKETLLWTTSEPVAASHMTVTQEPIIKLTNNVEVVSGSEEVTATPRDNYKG
jgi:hypothetical protein